ncbi:hypothetical protein HNQ91_004648 [Filimonas zeae]|nr:RagB/SusD family nutrient uptake outer membrane protein [Filimonas zeae]MDR6341575.1 hypothetical protein [Filimonas zeae]
MLRKYISFFLITAAVAGTVSCTKQMDDVKQTDVIDADKAYQSVSDLLKGTYGVYATLSNNTRMYYGSVLADEVKLSDENRGQGQGEYKWQFTATGVSFGFGQYFQTIDRLHRVLEVADNIPAANATEENTKKRIKAELLAIRGVAYLELLTVFMPQGYQPDSLGVPLVLSSALLGKPARSKVSEVMTRIEADLASGRAEALIPSAPTDPLRLSQGAIAAYQARAALLKRDWAKAAAYADEAIALSGKSLSRATYTAYFSDANESETIFKYRNGAAPQLNWRDANGDVFFEPADKVKNLFDRTNDIRFSTFFGADGGDTSIIIKYPGSERGPQTNDLKLIRLAEMYLIKAEASAEGENLTAAADAINALRAARITGYTNVTFADKATAINQILVERAKELCFEGFRFFDLKRRGLAVNRNPSDSRNTNWQDLPANSFRFALPIPQSEIFANPNVRQNAGYN